MEERGQNRKQDTNAATGGYPDNELPLVPAAGIAGTILVRAFGAASGYIAHKRIASGCSCWFSRSCIVRTPLFGSMSALGGIESAEVLL